MECFFKDGDHGVSDLRKCCPFVIVSLTLLSLTSYSSVFCRRTTTTPGNYKCVVEVNGKQSEGVFAVSLPVVEEDLIEAVQEQVNFVEGRKLVLEVTFVLLRQYL